MSYRQITIAALIATSAIFSCTALAECSGPQNLPSEQLHIAFSLNNDKISAPERTRINEWVLKVNSRYPVQKWVTVVGSAAEVEKNAEVLAMKRAVAAAQDALGSGLIRAPLQVRSQVYPVENPANVTNESREATIELSPGCPDNCCSDQ